MQVNPGRNHKKRDWCGKISVAKLLSWLATALNMGVLLTCDEPGSLTFL